MLRLENQGTVQIVKGLITVSEQKTVLLKWTVTYRTHELTALDCHVFGTRLWVCVFLIDTLLVTMAEEWFMGIIYYKFPAFDKTGTKRSCLGISKLIKLNNLLFTFKIIVKLFLFDNYYKIKLTNMFVWNSVNP